MPATQTHSLTDPATRARLIAHLRANGHDAVTIESDTTEHLLRRLCHLTDAYGSGDTATGIYLDESAGEFAGWWRVDAEDEEPEDELAAEYYDCVADAGLL